jgi:hypothetical protein
MSYNTLFPPASGVTVTLTATTNTLSGSDQESFGLPPCDTHLIAKLRTLQLTDPALLEAIRNKV